jgi:hypothetical protein
VGFNPNRKIEDGKMTPDQIREKRAESVRKKALSNPNTKAVLGMIKRMTADGMINKKIADELNSYRFNLLLVLLEHGAMHQLEEYNLILELLQITEKNQTEKH